MVAVRQAALVSDESALKACTCSRRCAIQIDDLYLYLCGDDAGIEKVKSDCGRDVVCVINTGG